MRLAILGAGSVRCTPVVIASLASYFGERPLEIRMFDSDLERLDLFDRLARLCFATTRNEHGLISTTSAEEALEGAERIVLQVGENCARKYLRQSHPRGIAELGAPAMIEQAVEQLLSPVPIQIDVLSLQREDIRIPRPRYFRVDWLPELDASERLAVPHQALRWIREEEYTFDFIREHDRSPLKSWLDDVNSLRSVTTADASA